ncbi:MAG: DUF1566 domain-containing protein [Labilithrix sp.]|nr:DUF1566 domain-containing protein [Labilithrix sp.]
MRVRLRFAVRGLVLVALVALPVSADAPEGQYPEFIGQNQRIRDLKTKLVWERSVSPAVSPSVLPSPLTFAEAGTVCTGGTRLPTLKELLSLVDEEPHFVYDLDQKKNVIKYIDRQAFGTHTPIDTGYWTSSAGSPTQAWSVDFGTGETSLANLSDRRYVRCVRFVP